MVLEKVELDEIDLKIANLFLWRTEFKYLKSEMAFWKGDFYENTGIFCCLKSPSDCNQCWKFYTSVPSARDIIKNFR